MVVPNRVTQQKLGIDEQVENWLEREGRIHVEAIDAAPYPDAPT